MKSPSPTPLFLFAQCVAALGFLSVSSSGKPPGKDDYRAHALRSEGDSSSGKALFNRPTLACSLCHSVDGSASKAGPDLSAAGDAFGRRDLIDAVLEPSSTISPGYGTVVVETHGGTSFQGILKGADATHRKLMGPDGKLITIKSSDIKVQSGTTVSLMPEGLQASLSLGEFNDLIEYLTSLKQEESALASNHGMPMEIAPLARPAGVEPFFEREFTVPRSGQETGLSSFRQVPGSGGVFLVLHQKGMVWKASKSESGESVSVFADMTGKVFCERGPNGLLDVAFHPRFRDNRKYYLFYQVFKDGGVASVIEEREFDEALEVDSGKEGRLIINIPSVAEDHSGGCLQFGADGYLYIAMGDTGPHNDPNGHSQNLGLLPGKLMRIDVDIQGTGSAYAIPKDNPFTGKEGVRPEIWAYGFRNPWRFSFDRLNGDLWLADVGQDRVEEVSIVRAGENHGWNVYEAFEPFSNEFRKEGVEYVMPAFAYRRKYGNSVTGGFTYRGKGNVSFQGVHVCGDYTSKIIFGLLLEEGMLKTARQIGKLPQRIASFSEDEDGNLFAVGYEGKIYRIVFTDAVFE